MSWNHAQHRLIARQGISCIGPIHPFMTVAVAIQTALIVGYQGHVGFLPHGLMTLHLAHGPPLAAPGFEKGLESKTGANDSLARLEIQALFELAFAVDRQVARLALSCDLPVLFTQESGHKHGRLESRLPILSRNALDYRNHRFAFLPNPG